MERYWLFVGYRYYPSGGMQDYHSSHNTLSWAREVYEEVQVEGWNGSIWGHIYDSLTGVFCDAATGVELGRTFNEEPTELEGYRS